MAKIERLGKIVLQIYMPKREQEKEAPYVVDLVYEGKIVRYVLDSVFVNITNNIELVKSELFAWLGKKGEEVVDILLQYEYTAIGFNACRDYTDITASKDGADSLETIEELKSKVQPYGCNMVTYHIFESSTMVTLRCR
jgi:hypothetical protein